MARDVTARDSTPEPALLDRRSTRWHAGPPPVVGRGAAAPTVPNPAGATLSADEPTPSTLARSLPPEVRDGS